MSTVTYRGVVDNMPEGTAVRVRTKNGEILATRAVGEPVRGVNPPATPHVWVTPLAGGSRVVATGWRPA